MPFEAASLECAAIAGAAPVLLAALDLAEAFFGAAFFGADFLAGAFFGFSFEEKMPVMLSMMDDIGWPSVEFDKQCRRPGNCSHPKSAAPDAADHRRDRGNVVFAAVGAAPGFPI
ncbi:hypothetical protein [Mesorhizobium sp.]|uniref:hypothetical protein n=1 Tax=Mesorhizobium sp. TaxID=1871066 RepID=UPI0025B9C2E6|nr:hypothetical protein [Mesorhizobium sp.]